MRHENGNGNNPIRKQIEAELNEVGKIYLDYCSQSRCLREESGLTIPQVRPETIAIIRQSLAPVISDPNPIAANKAIETGINNQMLYFARMLEEYGHNFRAGAGFACLVFRKLNELGFNFPPISPKASNSFNNIYQEALNKYAQKCPSSTDPTEINTAFFKVMLLFGFLEPKSHEDENPELIKLFEEFGSSRPFAKEGATLVYEVKTHQYLLNLQSKT